MFRISSTFLGKQITDIFAYMRIFPAQAPFYFSKFAIAFNRGKKRSVKAKYQERSASDKVMALKDIQIQHRNLIDGDAILRNDFKRLVQSMTISQPPSTESSHTILLHLIVEVKAGAIDDQRITNESFSSSNMNYTMDADIQERFKLQHALENYQRTYFAAF